MDKPQAMVLISLCVFFFGGQAAVEIYEEHANIEKSKTGLEECPREIGSIHTIWVKNCTEYTTMLQKLEEERKPQ